MYCWAGEGTGPSWPRGQRTGPLSIPCLSFPTWARQVQPRVPWQGHSLNGSCWFFPPLELPWVQGMVWAHLARCPAAGSVFQALLHFVKAAIYLHPKKVLLRVGSDLRLRCCVCVQPWKYWIYWLCQTPCASLGSASTSLPRAPGLCCPLLWGWETSLCTLVSSVPVPAPRPGQQRGAGGFLRFVPRKGGECRGRKGNEALSPVQTDNEKCPKHRQPSLHHGIVHYETRKN